MSYINNVEREMNNGMYPGNDIGDRVDKLVKDIVDLVIDTKNRLYPDSNTGRDWDNVNELLNQMVADAMAVELASREF